VNANRFDDYFLKTSGHEPLDYQRSLAGGDDGRACHSHLINIPTGLGKTAAMVIAWLWNRVELGSRAWPRRLVYCLPMRTLVEQTVTRTKEWLAKSGCSGTVEVHVLMGGEDATEWDAYPEKLAILIGTQDMLLSRALNRGYGMSRYRWPRHFGLLNSDCLWVLDEIQLMGPGVATASQLEVFRRTERFSSCPEGRSVTWYASATADLGHLQTRDWRTIKRQNDFLIELSPDEKSVRTGTIGKRLRGTKRLSLLKHLIFGDSKTTPAAELLRKIVDEHKSMVNTLASAPVDVPRRTLVFCNTVARAVAVHKGIQELLEADEIDVVLLHSRFRASDREGIMLRLENTPAASSGQIVVSTQVLEAGIDLSSAILWTEIAPLASLVQRLGRLNRKGEFGYNGVPLYGFAPAVNIIGISARNPEPKRKKEDKEAARKEAEKRYRPYEKAKCDEAWENLHKLDGDASSAALKLIDGAVAASIDRCPYSLHSHELLDFFDTDANLSLGFTDVSPFVRGTDRDTDFYVAWRDWRGSEEGKPPAFSADYQRQELCAVSIGKVSESREVLARGWLWRGKDAGWASAGSLEIIPGMTLLLPTGAGGYSPNTGWTGRKQDAPVKSVYEPGTLPSDEEMLSSLNHGWRSIADHTSDVRAEWATLIGILGGVDLSPDELQAISEGINWHDAGKNHLSWKEAARSALEEAGVTVPEGILPLAKFSLSDSPKLRAEDENGNPKYTGRKLNEELKRLRRLFRPGMAHEVASALAFRQSEQSVAPTQRSIPSLLAEYLIMSHHGHVRKVLRDEIPKQPNNARDAESVRGVSHGDRLDAVNIGGVMRGCEALSTDCRRMGRDPAGNESYTRGVLRLLDHYGPFRLAFYEALFRAADVRASMRVAAVSDERRII
jgi:CRISPR-associated endonuclease/helicase Cas3